MTYTKKQFLEDVAKEAKALKRNATKEELAKLEAHILDPTDFNTCVYGLMTGDCRSDRACELIFASCKRYFHNPFEGRLQSTVEFAEIAKNVNGSKIPDVQDADEFSETRTYGVEIYSSIESYIVMPDAKNANLIAFLKGERKDLVL